MDKIEPENIQYVGFWKRVCAMLLDTIIISPLLILYMQHYKYFVSKKMVLPILLYYFVTFAFDIFFNFRFGATPGKLIMRYRIVNENGRFISLQKAIIRFSFNFINAILYILKYFVLTNGMIFNIVDVLYDVVTLIILIDVLAIVFNKEKRALHDYLAGSYVITKETWLQHKSVDN
jgi:uncharacterized RDD family membrane protein YckC